MWQKFEEYMVYLEIDKGLADSTLRARRRTLRSFQQFLEKRGVDSLDRVTRRHIAYYIDFLVEEGYAYSTIMREQYVGVGAVLRWAYREGEVSESVMERIERQTIKSRAREAMTDAEKKNENSPPPHLSKDEVYEVAESVGPPKDRNSLLVKLLFWTGIRASEAELIEWDDINLDEPSIRIYSPKTDTSRTVSYPASELNPELRDWWYNGRLRYKTADESERLFIGLRGPITTHWINKIVREAATESGHQTEARTTKAGNTRSEATSHLLRHSHAMHYLNHTDTELEAISQHLGHSSVSTTEQFYAQSTKDRIVREFS